MASGSSYNLLGFREIQVSEFEIANATRYCRYERFAQRRRVPESTTELIPRASPTSSSKCEHFLELLNRIGKGLEYDRKMMLVTRRSPLPKPTIRSHICIISSVSKAVNTSIRQSQPFFFFFAIYL